MSRRRYISTEISTDDAVNQLITQYGWFAGLFYTWLIPHVENDGSIKYHPSELLWQVVPGRREKSPSDIAETVEGIVNLGLGRMERRGGRVFLVLDLERFDKPRRATWRDRLWRKAVLARDRHTCTRCGSTELPLHAHHILPWAHYPEHRADIDNGATLCATCHRTEHARSDHGMA